MKGGCDTMATTPTENKYLKIIDDYIGREDIATQQQPHLFPCRHGGHHLG